MLLSVSAAWAQAPDPGYRVFRPDRPGPRPAVLFLSGCDGLAPSFAPKLYERRAERLRAGGHVVVFVDYLGRHGVKTCAGAISHEQAARDLLAAARWLRPQPAIDGTRIAAMGWSWGGRAVLVALTELPEASALISRAVTFYPDCRAVRPWTSPRPLLMLLGGADDMTQPGWCRDLAVKAPASTVKVIVYPGAPHGFDVPELSEKTRVGFGTLGYDKQAADAAWQEAERFLGNPQGG